MKLFLNIAILALTLGNSAHAAELTTPELITYDSQAKELLALSAAAQTADEFTLMQSKIEVLVQSGTAIQNLYAAANPVCAEQFAKFQELLPSAWAMTVKQAHDVFHDGDGLPAAPRHCYYGRSMVVHPVLNYLRLNDGLTDSERGQVVHEFEEIIEHLERIQRNLDNPPN